MTDEELLRRPVGWWLKEADDRLNGAFDRVLEGSDVDRRGWQALSSLSKQAVTRTELVASLKSFDTPEVLHRLLAELERRGWISEDGGLLRLTPTGAQTQSDLAPLVNRVRQQIQSALPPDDYLTLIRLLARFTEAL